MKLFKVAIPFQHHWLQFCNQNPELEARPWAEQQNIISQNWFGFPHVWQHALEPLGYHVTEVLANADIVQKKWAVENGIDYREAFWSYDIAKAQILKAKPDILFVADLFWFSYEWIQEVRQQCASIKLVIGWYGAPLEDKSILRGCDLVLSCIPEFVEKCRTQRLNSRHLNHSFDPRVFSYISHNPTPEIDLSFIGNVRRKPNFDSGRERILVELSHHTEIQIFSAAIDAVDTPLQLVKLFAKSSLYYLSKTLRAPAAPQPPLAKLPGLSKVSDLEKPPMRSVNPKLVSHLKRPVYGTKMFQTLSNSKLTLNKHIDASPRSASNMRMYEATGVGTCLVTDYKTNIRDLFEPDREVITYSSIDECIEKIEWLLSHPKARLAIAKAGQERTLKEHTLERRAVQLDEIIRQEIGRLCISA